MKRREFLAGIICAPAIVAATNIMPVKAYKLIQGDGFVRLSDFTYDGFNYVDVLGRKYCESPEGILSVDVRGGKIIGQTYKSVTAFFRPGEPLSNEWPVRIGILNDADHMKYISHLHSRRLTPVFPVQD